jgi:hypothetical protein
MTSVILYLLGVAALTWGLLKGIDWIHAVRYERAKARLRALDQAFADGFYAAMGEYGKSKVQAFQVITPDRPSDPYMQQVRHRIDALTGPGEASSYGKGS